MNKIPDGILAIYIGTRGHDDICRIIPSGIFFNIKLDQRMPVKGMLVLQEHFAELAK